MRQILLLFILGIIMSCAGTNNTIQMDQQEKEDFQISELKFNIKNDPANPVGYLALGKAYAKMGKYKEAMSQFNQALDTSPNYYEALLQKAILLRELGDNATAMPIFETLLSGKEAEKNAQRIGKSIGHPYKIRLLTSGA